MSPKDLSFLQFESPWLFEPGTIRLLAPPDGLSIERSPRRLLAGELGEPYIFETPSERRLYFTHSSTQSVMGLNEPDALVIVCDDAAHYISQHSDQVDVVLVDAFDPIGVAPTLASADFYMQAAQRLSPQGVLVMNFAGAPSRYPLHMERLRAAFGSTLLVPVPADDNLLLFAFRRRIPLPTTAKYESRAQYLQSRLTLEFPRYLRRICQGHVLA